MTIIEKIKKLKDEKNAIILAHNYQLPEVQDIADITGDSLGLSIEASRTSADIIVFCGVYFMAETAKILSPFKTILIPDKNSGCPMADMITPEQLRDMKKKHPGAKTLCYVNTSAEVKAESDVCCTSSNAMLVAQKAFNPTDEIIFAPDKNLAQYIASQTNRAFILWPGYCRTHERILPEYVHQAREKHPDSEVIVHPECNPLVTELADRVLSTGEMKKHVSETNQKSFIIGTETGMLYRLKQDNPGKDFYPVSEIAVCPNMKRNTLHKILRSLENMTDEIVLSEEIIKKAGKSIQQMIKYV